MDLGRPPFVDIGGQPRGPLRYVWDDTRASRDFRSTANWVLEAAAGLSVRAQMVLCVGLYEWLVWRFAEVCDDPAPVQIIEAAWCGTVDPRFLTFFELDRNAWLGPIRGPLWCAITWLRPAITDGDEQPDEIDDALQYLTRLSLHVLPNPGPFVRWLRGVLERFARLFPRVPDDPFDDIFSQEPGRRRGTLIGRGALDLAMPYPIEMGEPWAMALLASIDAQRNPYVARRGPAVGAATAG
jgi:hypothetical protein